MSDTTGREPVFDAPPPTDTAWERPTMLVPSQLEHRRPKRYTGRSAIIAIVSTLVFVGLIVLVLYTAPNAALVTDRIGAHGTGLRCSFHRCPFLIG